MWDYRSKRKPEEDGRDLTLHVVGNPGLLPKLAAIPH